MRIGANTLITTQSGTIARTREKPTESESQRYKNREQDAAPIVKAQVEGSNAQPFTAHRALKRFGYVYMVVRQLRPTARTP